MDEIKWGGTIETPIVFSTRMKTCQGIASCHHLLVYAVCYIIIWVCILSGLGAVIYLIRTSYSQDLRSGRSVFACALFAVCAQRSNAGIDIVILKFHLVEGKRKHPLTFTCHGRYYAEKQTRPLNQHLNSWI